ncbi:protein IQ-DOMAIN 1-like [Phalaenopsis equestris]|uniref:protein IQ-DOMAIN 1-like n=1 Tax=Phalaenopsis equestris TaxID=78828 RepID=UPI0009E4A6F5|nr:protein IQ-DOMAIN 1-like [Phalaenopsis equestris]XP_020574429.1 protein IQ-DOMAIN 1-like [Phalaenopsis equestris]
MGKRGKSWFRAVKRVFRRESKERKDQQSKKLDPERPDHSDPSSYEILPTVSSDVPLPPPPAPPIPPAPASVEVKFAEPELEQGKHVHSIANPSTTAAQSTAHVVQLDSSTKFADKSREEGAAIKIQTAFRGYLARRALRALRGLVRLKSLINGNTVKRQATTTLRCMQTLARVQAQIRSRRLRMIEDNQALQRQLLLKRERELENIRMSEDWDDSTQSKEQIEAGLLSKQEASIRRERALAYAFSHQWKNSSKLVNPTFMDPNNPHWGWSWLERWMAARPWEGRSTATDKELNSDRASMKSTNGGEIIKAYARRETNLNGTAAAASPKKSLHTLSRQSPATPGSKSFTGATKIKSASPKINCAPLDDDLRSMISSQSERPRRHSIAASSIRDDESLASSPAIPSYMAPTRSARAKTRTQSPSTDSKIETPPEKGSIGSVKKKLSFPNSPGPVRRHSGPPKVDVSVIQEAVASAEHNEVNAESR